MSCRLLLEHGALRAGDTSSTDQVLQSWHLALGDDATMRVLD
jgi:hypothetical protein